MKKRERKPLRLRSTPGRAASRSAVRPGAGWRLVNPKQTLFWKVDVLRAFGTKERYAVLRIRRLPSN
jgi:hypothetical protein